MKVLIDGKEVKCQNDVKIIHDIEGDELHVTCTHEGVVTDVVSGGEVIGTSSIEAKDIYETLMAGNDPMTAKTEGEEEWGA